MPDSGSSALHVGIVGGSIAGCAACIALLQSGHHVEIFERELGALVGRGAGIATPPAVIQQLREREIIRGRLDTEPTERSLQIVREGNVSRLGRTLALRPNDLVKMNWGDLHRNLRGQVPDEFYHTGRRVIGVESDDGKSARLRFDDDSKEDFDVAIFADGYDSLGRRFVSPETKLTYRGYVIWRGVLERKHLSDGGSFLERSMFRVYYPEGHAVFYLVPWTHSEERESRVNWGCYLLTPDLPAFLIDRDGRQRSGSIPPGLMRASQEAGLKRWAREALPPYFADIAAASTNTFAQAIYTADLARYRRNRACVLGDAGFLVQPFTSSGVSKATLDALELANALQNVEDVDEALESWGAKELERGRRLLSVGERMEPRLIRHVPDLAAMDIDTLVQWLEENTRILSEAFRR